MRAQTENANARNDCFIDLIVGYGSRYCTVLVDRRIPILLPYRTWPYQQGTRG